MVLGIFVPVIPVLYGLAWVFLPEQRDGRIHIQQLFRGHADVALLGAVLMMLIGLANLSPWFWFSNQSPWFLIGGTIIAAIALAVIVIAVSRGSSPTRTQRWTGTAYPMGAPTNSPMPSPGGPAGPPAPGMGARSPQGPPSPPQPEASRKASAMNAASSPNMGEDPTPESTTAPGPGQWSSIPTTPPRAPAPASSMAPNYAWNAPAPMGPPPVWRPGPVTKPRRVSASWNMAIFGIVLLILALTVFQMIGTGNFYSIDSMKYGLIGGGACMIIVGLAMAIASLRDRGAGWLIALSLVGVTLSLPTMAVAQWAVSYDPESMISSYDWTATDIHDLSDTVLYLSDAPVDITKTINVSSDGNLQVYVREGQPVKFIIAPTQGRVGVEYLVSSENPTEWVPQTGFNDKGMEFHSPTWTARTGITVVVSSAVWDVTITQDTIDDEGMYGVPPTEGPSGAQSGAQSGAPTSSPAPSTLLSPTPIETPEPGATPSITTDSEN